MASRSDRTRTFPSEFASVRLAREFVRSALNLPPPVRQDGVSDVELAVSELTTNGVRHGSGDPVTVELDRDLHRVMMSVTSTLAAGAPDDPAAWESADPNGPTGHGIGIVRAVSTDLRYQVTGRSVAASCRFPITL
jgi:anti-sigma regulatory factor (Ser/Thr protein kinase)